MPIYENSLDAMIEECVCSCGRLDCAGYCSECGEHGHIDETCPEAPPMDEDLMNALEYQYEAVRSASPNFTMTLAQYLRQQGCSERDIREYCGYDEYTRKVEPMTFGADMTQAPV